jgi:hypothetical protein
MFMYELPQSCGAVQSDSGVAIFLVRYLSDI